MTEVTLIFSLDYEIFGDGSGTTTREQCIPTSHLANVLELHGARLTVFAEIGQQIYFRKHNIDHQYAPVERQLKDLHMRGHDVQLHIHPMWFFAPPPVADRPTLDPALFDLSMREPHQIEDIVSRSCDYLATLLSTTQSEYRPIAYRAGAWSMQRKDVLFPILARNGIQIDSTIAPGARFTGSYGSFDYSNFSMQPSWPEGALLEIPILTSQEPLSGLKHLNREGMMTRRIVKTFYPTPLASGGQSKLTKLKTALARGYLMADFNFLSSKQLARMIERYAHLHADYGRPVPIMLIGHSKTTYFADRLFQLFELLNRTNLSITTTTLSKLMADVSAPCATNPSATSSHQNV
jgi:hypothetical protein